MKIFLFAYFMFFYLSVFSQQKSNQFSIANWKNNKKAALSLTFDDAIPGQFIYALPLLNQYKIKATFFITINNFIQDPGGWNLVKPAAESGHEIGNHTMNHPMLHTISTDSMAYEFDECNKEAAKNLPPLKVETMAYPYGDGGDLTDSEQLVRNVAYNYFVAARSVQYRDIFYNPYDFAKTNDDYYRVNSEMIDSTSVTSFARHLDSTIQFGAWYVATYHGIETGWIIVNKKDFEKNLQSVAQRKNELWISPFINVAKYHKEKNCAMINVVENNKHAITIILKDTLNNKTWNEPLTINYKTLARIKSIVENGKPISFTNKNGMIVFNVTPSSQTIKIIKS